MTTNRKRHAQPWRYCTVCYGVKDKHAGIGAEKCYEHHDNNDGDLCGLQKTLCKYLPGMIPSGYTLDEKKLELLLNSLNLGQYSKDC